MRLTVATLIFCACLTGPARAAEMTLEKTPQVTALIATVGFAPTIKVANVPAPCSRCYVGIYPSAAPTAVRLEWLYLTGAKIQTPEVLVGSLTGGVLTFPAIFPEPGANYEARLYRWTPADTPDVLITTFAITTPPARLDRRTLPAENPTTVTRVPVGNKDEVTVKRAGGGEERITIDRGVLFEMSPVTGTGTAPISVVVEP